MTPGYSLEDIAALKAVPPGDRVDGMSLQIKKDIKENPAWYTWIDAEAPSGDDYLSIAASDNPASGAWIRDNVSDVNPQVDITVGNLGNFVAGKARTEFLGGLLQNESYITLNLPSNCASFISEWGLTFHDTSQAFDVRLHLSGHYNTADFNHYATPWITYNFYGFLRETFSVAWYSQVRFDDYPTLDAFPVNQLSYSICQSNNVRQLQLANRVGYNLHLVASFTYGLVQGDLVDI